MVVRVVAKPEDGSEDRNSFEEGGIVGLRWSGTAVASLWAFLQTSGSQTWFQDPFMLWKIIVEAKEFVFM